MSESRTSSFSSSISTCPSMTDQSISNSEATTLSPTTSVRSLSPLPSPTEVPTFCLTPDPGQSEFPETIIESPINSPEEDKSHDSQDQGNKELNGINSNSSHQRLEIGEQGNSRTDILSNSTKSRPNPPPVPKRRMTSPSFLIPPTLKMSSLSSLTIPSPTNIPPPLSPNGRAKVSNYVTSLKAAAGNSNYGKPKIGRSATISTSTASTSISEFRIKGREIQNLTEMEKENFNRGLEKRKDNYHDNHDNNNNNIRNTDKRIKPDPLILQKSNTNTNTNTKTNHEDVHIKRNETFTSFSNLNLNLESSPNIDEWQKTPTAQHKNDGHSYAEIRTPSPETNNNTGSANNTAKPLTSFRLGNTITITDSNQQDTHLLNQDRWYTEEELDMKEPRLNENVSPGWGEFSIINQ
ncbi:uncharacterized protein L201_004636 [Kwoniella dendrophila CBS 6074]|uniref:Uncharacterized protein n=1 Tax=Kwoniella dendrophila CBS 6074 TaxID=1295534 RepID=A0AAX4JW92_9TREE